MHSRKKKLAAFGRLLDIMDDLREKCPWDRKQTMESLRHLTIEETYELGDAILDRNLSEIKKEVGDLLLHLVFYAKIGSEKESFDIADVCDTLCDKLKERHPHVYGDVNVENEDQVKKNWEKLKLKKKSDSVLSGVPKSLPALVKAERIQDKVAGVGFDWDNRHQVLDKVKEEIAEIEEAVSEKDNDAMEDEMGDVFFSLINYCRYINVNAEAALERTNKKFIKRFQSMEEMTRRDNTSLSEMSLDEMDQLWEKSKSKS
jgi:XTP/dITP diphosphohydrolase